MLEVIVGLVLGLLIGAGCKWFDIPIPSPPKLVGALLVASITVGYIAADKLIATRYSSKGPATTQEMCGGPTGAEISRSSSQKGHLETE